MQDLIRKSLEEDKAEKAFERFRNFRPEFVSGAEVCESALLAPANDQGLARPLRLALSLRMAKALGVSSLVSTLTKAIETEGSTPPLIAIADGQDEVLDAFHTAIVHHADLITVTPRDATRQDLEALQQAGLTIPQIIALSELIAFINFEARIIAGLAALEVAE